MKQKLDSIEVYVCHTDEDGNDVGDLMADILPHLSNLSPADAHATLAGDYRALETLLVREGVMDKGDWLELDGGDRAAIREVLSA